MRRPAALLAFILFLIPAVLLSYRTLWLGSPLIPTTSGQTWLFSVMARLKGGEGETRLSLGLPTEHGGRILLEERVRSGNLGFRLLPEGENRFGVWSGTFGPKGEEIAYRTTLLTRPGISPKPPPSSPPPPLALDPAEEGLLRRLTAQWPQKKLADRRDVALAAAEGRWKDPPPENSDLRAWMALQEKRGRKESLMALFWTAGFPSRLVEGLRLAETLTTKPMAWLEVWTGLKWERLDVETGESYATAPAFLPLASGGTPAAAITGGEFVEVRWNVARQVISKWDWHYERLHRSDRLLDRWSLFHLPKEVQATFRILLLVPMGALLISLLRNLVGFPTFGIFMPVLMALSFRNTGLGYGLAIFGGILLVGYGMRRGLDHLHLLLVPRMSVILTMVIGLFTFLALLGQKLAIREFMSVALLPFVILTMTIERFFVAVEETGAREGFRMAAGSAAVSVITYEIISWEPLQLTFFIYPELLAAVMAGQVLIGRYTGFRLSEIFRFRSLRNLP